VENHVEVLLSPFFTLRGSNLFVDLVVKFVAKAHEGEGRLIGRATIIEESLAPPVKVLMGLLLGNIVDKAAAVSTAIEGVS